MSDQQYRLMLWLLFGISLTAAVVFNKLRQELAATQSDVTAMKSVAMGIRG